MNIASAAKDWQRTGETTAQGRQGSVIGVPDHPWATMVLVEEAQMKQHVLYRNSIAFFGTKSN